MAKDDKVGSEALHLFALFLANLVKLAKDVAHEDCPARQALDSLGGVQARSIIIAFDGKHGRNLL